MTASGRKRSFQGFPWSLNDAAAADLVDDDDNCGPAGAVPATRRSCATQVSEQGADSGDRVVPDSSSCVLGKSTVVEQNRSVMGRGKIEIKRIENPTSRQVTFSKRRGGLMKKGHELSVLCDADVAVIIFSSVGKLFEFASSGTSMRDMLERYSKCPDASGSVGGNCDFMGRELMSLRQQVEKLQDSQRHMQGEDLHVLSIPDLLNLEQQLDTGASRVRARKNQLLLEEVEELRRKEKAFLSANEDLRQKLADLKRMPEVGGASAPGVVPSGGQASQLVASIPTPYEAGGSSSQRAPATLHLAATVHPNLRDPQTSQTSLHLGLFPESLMPSSSRRTSHQSPTEQGESSMRWEHYRSQK